MRRNVVIVGRLVFAALSLAGVLRQFWVTINGDYGVVNFFSYFTILSNIIAVVVFARGAIQLARRQPPSSTDIAVRGASVVYMLFVGVVFSTLLRGADLGPLEPWVNVVHHYLMPVAVLLDWVFWPPHRRISSRTVGLYLIFPVAYSVFCLVRGAIAGWYPYPFFNPNVSGGYGGVALLCVVMLVAFLVIALFVRWVGGVLAGRSAETPTR